MALIVAFVIALMSSVFHPDVTQCKHGAHVHVIWKGPHCGGDSGTFHR